MAADAGGAAEAGEGELQDVTDRIMEYQRREFALLSQIALREREMRGLRRRAGEAEHGFSSARKDSLSSAYVDPAVNIEIAMLRQTLKEKDSDIEQLKQESHSATFHPNSIQGQKLLKKCTHLLEENAELGRQLGEERVQILRIQIAVERKKRGQLRQHIAECDQHAELVDSENERMQQKIADLGQCLKEARNDIDRMKKDIEEWNTGAKRKRDKPLEIALAPIPVPTLAAPLAAEVAESGGKRRRKDR